MELKICDIPPTICLNMIVKNESHIIKNTLEKLCNKIKFSYWVICDTGSTDNTREIITDFFVNPLLISSSKILNNIFSFLFFLLASTVISEIFFPDFFKSLIKYFLKLFFNFLSKTTKRL